VDLRFRKEEHREKYFKGPRHFVKIRTAGGKRASPQVIKKCWGRQGLLEGSKGRQRGGEKTADAAGRQESQLSHVI